jgi:hypothetical protein
VNQTELKLSHDVRHSVTASNVYENTRITPVDISDESVAHVSENTQKLANQFLFDRTPSTLPFINLEHQQSELIQKSTDLNNHKENLKTFQKYIDVVAIIAGILIWGIFLYLFFAVHPLFILGLCISMVTPTLHAAASIYAAYTLNQERSNIESLTRQFNQENRSASETSADFYRGRNFTAMIRYLENQLKEPRTPNVEELREDISKLRQVAKFYQNLGEMVTATATPIIFTLPDPPRASDDLMGDRFVPSVAAISFDLDFVQFSRPIP